VGTERRAYGANEGPPPLDAALAALASRQHGVVSRAQLVELGFTRHAIRRRLQVDRLRRLHAGVYAVGHWALTSASHDLAAVFACGPQALLSHRAAGRRLQLVRGSAARIDVTALRGCKEKPGIAVHRTRLFHPDDRSTVDGIPVTSVARTLVDLADVLSERLLAAAVNEAEVQRLFDLTAIEKTLSRLPGRQGRPRLERVLAAYTDPPGYTTTKAERLFLRLCREHGLPNPERVFLAGYELDFYWSDVRLAIEIDGGPFHRTRRAFHEDRRRDRRLAGLGIQVARAPWRDLTDGAVELVAELKAIRARRLPGWTQDAPSRSLRP
jgi:very-short-patch-repair endonuclease